jgi:hypothetical protein
VEGSRNDQEGEGVVVQEGGEDVAGAPVAKAEALWVRGVSLVHLVLFAVTGRRGVGNVFCSTRRCQADLGGEQPYDPVHLL